MFASFPSMPLALIASPSFGRCRSDVPRVAWRCTQEQTPQRLPATRVHRSTRFMRLGARLRAEPCWEAKTCRPALFKPTIHNQLLRARILPVNYGPRYRRFQIAVPRQPSAKLEFQQGYYAPRTFDRLSGTEREVNSRKRSTRSTSKLCPASRRSPPYGQRVCGAYTVAGSRRRARNIRNSDIVPSAMRHRRLSAGSSSRPDQRHGMAEGTGHGRRFRTAGLIRWHWDPSFVKVFVGGRSKRKRESGVFDYCCSRVEILHERLPFSCVRRVLLRLNDGRAPGSRDSGLQ